MINCDIVPIHPAHPVGAPVHHPQHHVHHVHPAAPIVPATGTPVHHHHHHHHHHHITATVTGAPHAAAHQAACADHQKLIAPHVVHAPGPGQHVVVDVLPNQPLIFDFNPLDTQATRNGSDVTLTFSDGGDVVLHQLVEPNGTAPTPLELPDGTVLSVADLFSAFDLGNILPAAGPDTLGGNGTGGEAGSGHVFTPFEPGDLGPGVPIVGPLGFSGLERTVEFTRGAGGQFGVPGEGETPNTPTEPPPPPPSLEVPPDLNVVWEYGTPEGTNPAGPAVTPGGVNLLTGAVDSNPAATITVIDITGTGGTAAVSGSTTISGEYGTLTVNPNGTYTYTLDGNDATVQYLETHQTLHDTFTYVATDGTLTDSSTLVITINGYGGPVPLDDHNSIPNTALPDFVSGNVLTDHQITNYDPVPNTFTDFEVTQFTQSASQAGGNPTAANAGQTLTDQYGDTVVINSNGTYTFTLNESNPTIAGLLQGTSIIDTFTYTASDALADNPVTGNADNTATANLYITINGEVCTLVVDPQVQTVFEDGTPTPGFNTAGPDVVTGNLLAGATDTLPGPITVADITSGNTTTVVNGATTITGEYGTLTVNPNGTYTYTLDNNNTTVEYLETHQTLQETFTYIATDGTQTASSTLVVTIDGFGTPDPQNDSNTIANNADPSSVGGNVLTDHPITNGEPGTHTFTDFEVTQFGQGGNTAAAGGTVTDIYGDTLTINSNGTYTFNLNESNSTIHNLGAGQSIVETFTYTASDALADNPTTGNADNTATANLVITITGTGQETSSLAVDPQVNIVYEDGTTNPGFNPAGPDVGTGNLLTGAVDGNPSATITVIDITGPGGTEAVNGATTINGQYGTLTVNPNGTYTYTLDNNNATVELLETHQTLQETFTYVATDGSLTDSSTLVVTIDGFGTPGPHDDSNSITSTALPDFVTGNVLTDNQITNGDPGAHTFTDFEVTQFGQGGNTAVAGGTITDVYGDTLTINSNGSYTFTLNEHNTTIQNLLFGTSIVETFSYTASDALADNPTTGNADNTANANLYITINGEYCVITAEPDAASLTVGLNSSATGNVLANDTATDPAALVVASFAYNGTTVAAGQTLTDNLGDTLTINANGTYTFTLNQSNSTIANLGAGQTITETFTYTDSDNASSASTSVTFTISGATSGGDATPQVSAVHTGNVVGSGLSSGAPGTGISGGTSTGNGTHHDAGTSTFAGLDTIDLSHVTHFNGAAQGGSTTTLKGEDLLTGGSSIDALLSSGGGPGAAHPASFVAASVTPASFHPTATGFFHFLESAAPLNHPHPHAH
jgi:VCBS repeat-containing protein